MRNKRRKKEGPGKGVVMPEISRYCLLIASACRPHALMTFILCWLKTCQEVNEVFSPVPQVIEKLHSSREYRGVFFRKASDASA